MEVKQIEERNKNTWAWSGCQNLYAGNIICLSTGSPPMPASIPNAICGPQVNDTKKPADMSTLSDLNPCPLRACCDIWGQCGITTEFCTISHSDTGAPGTAKPGENGCISNCGTDIVNNGNGPASFARVAYYEAFNVKRPCLHMAPTDINTELYTHIHFAFADITSDFRPDITTFSEVFAAFKSTQGAKKVVSFGGWAFSTEPATYNIFRTGVQEGSRAQFAHNIVQFVEEHGLDGVDFDWEYPGAPDIPGIPPGGKDDGNNYLEFLKLVRSELSSGKTLSIAAPASFWYLKGFPIEEISKVVDYIIFMTYDLHGQWDYGNKFSGPGCGSGNCLRSQVNRTETHQALVMVTKAGVPSQKLFIGMALYGRSFQMTDPGCQTEMCTYSGPASGALPGECTETAGYISNYEIDQIISDGSSQANVRSTNEGDILVYKGDQWISFMTPATYDERVSWIKGLNFGGASDWAIDLNSSHAGFGIGTNGSGVVYISPDIWQEPNPTIACQPPCTFVLPPWSLAVATTLTQPPVTMIYEDTYPSGLSTTTSRVVVTLTTTILIPPLVTTLIQVSNLRWTRSTDAFYVTSSVVFPPLTLTESPRATTESDSSTHTVAGYVYTYRPGPWPPNYDPANPKYTPIPPPPPPGKPPKINVKIGSPGPKCRPGQICGLPCLLSCIPEVPCVGLCGCLGPFCGGGGGELGGSSNCLGPGCASGPGSGSGSDNVCEKKKTAQICTVVSTRSVIPPANTFSSWSFSACRPTVGCSATDSTTTTTRTTEVPFVTPIVIADTLEDQAPLNFPFDKVLWGEIQNGPGGSSSGAGSPGGGSPGGGSPGGTSPPGHSNTICIGAIPMPPVDKVWLLTAYKPGQGCKEHPVYISNSQKAGTWASEADEICHDYIDKRRFEMCGTTLWLTTNNLKEGLNKRLTCIVGMGQEGEGWYSPSRWLDMSDDKNICSQDCHGPVVPFPGYRLRGVLAFENVPWKCD